MEELMQQGQAGQPAVVSPEQYEPPRAVELDTSGGVAEVAPAVTAAVASISNL
jgi:hypothetical protein